MKTSSALQSKKVLQKNKNLQFYNKHADLYLSVYLLVCLSLCLPTCLSVLPVCLSVSAQQKSSQMSKKKAAGNQVSPSR